MAYRKLGRKADQRKAMLRSLTTSLLENGKIVTTETRAKEVQSIVEEIFDGYNCSASNIRVLEVND